MGLAPAIPRYAVHLTGNQTLSAHTLPSSAYHQKLSGGTCMTCNLPKCRQPAVHAICSACNLQRMQSAQVHAICSACNLQRLQSAVRALHAICLNGNRQSFCRWQVFHVEDGSSALCPFQRHTGSHESGSQNCSPAPRGASAHSLGRERGGHRVLPRDLQL